MFNYIFIYNFQRKRRDMLYAESYVSRVKERFKDRPDLFSEFNQLLFQFANAFSGTLVEKEVRITLDYSFEWFN